jgi:sodium-dependent dicarboxylate transporter 2/3/5
MNAGPIGRPPGAAAGGEAARAIGRLAGIGAFAAMLLAPAPSAISGQAWTVAALAALMAVWWMSEAVPLAATALAPLIVLPVLGVLSFERVAQSYAHPLVFLFLGGFVIAKALEHWSLHRLIAGAIIRRAPASGAGIIAALMAATAFLSMWISNTATAMVMVPIAQSIAGTAGRDSRRAGAAAGEGDFAAALLLGVAFSSTIGGMATLIGTPPNALLAGYLETAVGVDVGFGQWMALGVPVALVLLPVTWFILTRVVFTVRVGDAAQAARATEALGRTALTPGARRAAAVIALAGLALVLRPLIETVLPGLALSDAGIAVAGALLLMLLPSGDGTGGRLIGWEQAKEIRWDVLILFGGGLALANAIEESGLSQGIGSVFAVLDGLPVALIVLFAMALVVFLGELASNTAMAAIFLPIAGAAAVGLGADVLDLVLPIGLAASLGFMLPVATPPNAIAYGTGWVTSAQMLRAGTVLDAVSILVAYVIAMALVPVIFGGGS